MPIRILHCADLHLDSPLHGSDLPDTLPRDLLVQAPRRAFEDLVREAISRKAHLVLIAGDLFDDSDNDARTILWLRERMRDLGKAGIGVGIVHGNHDFGALGANFVQWPENVHVFGKERPETWSLEFEGRAVAVHGQSFPSRHVSTNIAQGYPAAVPGALNIGLLHTSLVGTTGHDPYAPCTLADLEAKAYEYWALGHVHKRELWTTRTGWAAYAGNLQGRDPGERGEKGFLWVECGEAASEPIFVPCDRLRWREEIVDLSGVASFDEMESRLRDFAAFREPATIPELVRLRLAGACDLDARLRQKTSERDALVESCLAERGRHVESIRVETVPARTLDDLRSLDDLRAAVLQSVESLKGDTASGSAEWTKAREEIVYHLGEWLAADLRDAPLDDELWNEVLAQALGSLEETA